MEIQWEWGGGRVGKIGLLGGCASGKKIKNKTAASHAMPIQKASYSRYSSSSSEELTVDGSDANHSSRR